MKSIGLIDVDLEVNITELSSKLTMLDVRSDQVAFTIDEVDTSASILSFSFTLKIEKVDKMDTVASIEPTPT